jgi:RNA polymerase sigma factor (sigma-70 family)
MSESAAAAATPVSAPALDLPSRSDADLFEAMALGRACTVRAHAAFAEFHRRHAPYLFAICSRRYGGAAEEIVAEVLRRVYAAAARFDRSTLTDGASPEATRRLVRAWVGRIVRWVAADHFADLKRAPQTVELDRIGSLLEPLRGQAAGAAEVGEELVARVRGVIEGLPEREQEIAWTLAHGWSPGNAPGRWSETDLDAIGRRFGLTRDNIRQVRGRLIRKLRSQLEPLLKGDGDTA